MIVDTLTLFAVIGAAIYLGYLGVSGQPLPEDSETLRWILMGVGACGLWQLFRQKFW